MGRWLCQKLQNVPNSNPKPDLHNIKAHNNAHINFGENPLRSYCPETQIRMCMGQITVKIDEICHLQSCKRSPQYQYIYQVWWKSIDIYSNYCPEMKIGLCHRQITQSKINEICPLAISTISMHISSFVKIHLHSLGLSSQNENMDRWMDDNLMNRQPMWNHNTHQLSCDGL